jgi:hypothetical protein
VRIFSKESDYYDPLQDHSKDRLNKVWERKERIVDVYHDKLEVFSNRDQLRFHNWHHPKSNVRWGSDWTRGWLIIAGETYPFVLITYSESYWSLVSNAPVPKGNMFFDYTSLEQTYPTLIHKKGINKWRTYDRSKEFKEFFNFKPDMTELCIELRTPIILTPTFKTRQDKHVFIKVSVDVNLKDIDAAQLLDAYQMYQKLDQFYSNQIATADVQPPIPITDTQKQHNHGFTHEYSFRKEPNKK